VPTVKEQDFLKKLGARIRVLRKEKNISLNDLAEQFGLEKSSLSKLENGKSNSTVLTLLRISSALNIPIEKLFK